MTARTVYENLQGMLSDAVALKRPAAEVDGIRRQLAAYDTTAPAFEVDGVAYDLTSMLEANRDSQELIDWLRTAQVGDRFPAFVECRRVA